MSGYSYPSDHSGYYTVPQYTQSQINTYYAQYGCYPPQPYQIIPDTYYAQPAVVASQHAAHSQHSQHSSSTLYPHYPADSAGNLDSVRVTGNKSPRTWKCDLNNCTSTANFTRLADLQRHQATVHGVGTPEFPCSVKDCTRVGDKGFTRRDHLVEHLRNFHHIDIPKRRPGERSAYPLGLPNFP